MIIKVWFTLPFIPEPLTTNLEVVSMNDTIIKKALQNQLDSVLSEDLKKDLNYLEPKISLVIEQL